MSSYSRVEMQKILNGGYSHEQLKKMFPTEAEKITTELTSIFAKNDPKLVNDYINKTKCFTEQWKNRAAKSGNNPKVMDTAFPFLLKGKLIFLELDCHINGLVKKGNSMRSDTLNVYNKLIVNKLLKLTKTTPKPPKYARMNFVWRFVTQKRTALSGLGRSGKYCIYTEEFITELTDKLKGKKVLEIGAGNGLLAQFLAEKGIDIIATDDFSWSDKITFGSNVEKLPAFEALQKYQPEAVLCSWSPPGNSFEAQVFKTTSVNLYISIGCSLDFATGNRKTYTTAQKHFTVQNASTLANRLFPHEVSSEVLVFERRPRSLTTPSPR